MRTYLAAFIVSFAIVAAITPLIIALAMKMGWVDRGNRRSIHQRPIPRVGGLGILLGTLAPITALLLYRNDISDFFFDGPANSLVILLGGFLISLLGFIDDIHPLRARYKLFAQILLATGVWYMGFAITKIGTPFGVLDFGVFSWFVTVLWIVGIINAFNLIDGMDGLSSGIAFFVAGTVMVLAISNRLPITALVSASLAGAVVGFLLYNFNPAKVFMGDCGSMFIGYILAVLSLKGASKSHTIVGLLVPLMAMGLPLLDASLAILRRILRKQPIMSPDRQHIHHILLSRGLTQKKTVLLMYGISMLLTVLALGTLLLKDSQVFLAVAVFSIIIFVVITKLGYMEILFERYRIQKDKPIQQSLEAFLLERIADTKLETLKKAFAGLPVKGFAVLDGDGSEVYAEGEKDNIQYIDMLTGKERVVRFYWEKAVPALSSRESTLFSLIAKAITLQACPEMKPEDLSGLIVIEREKR